MADMADMFLEDVCSAEHYRDLYVSGCMGNDEAYELGIVNEQGCEVGVVEAWSRSSIGSLDSINTELKIASLELDVHLKSDRDLGLLKSLNDKALINLSGYAPTCNTCELIMKDRQGKFGKFYFCKCPEQATVSDDYWQKMKRKVK